MWARSRGASPRIPRWRGLLQKTNRAGAPPGGADFVKRSPAQQAAVNALVVADGRPVSTSQIMEWSYVEQRLIGKRNSSRDRHNYRRAIRRACEAVAVKAGRSTSIGRPLLWLLRPDLAV